MSDTQRLKIPTRRVLKRLLELQEGAEFYRSQIVREMSLSDSTVGAILKRLKRDGWIEVRGAREGEIDRLMGRLAHSSRKYLRLTPKGRQAAIAALEAHAKWRKAHGYDPDGLTVPPTEGGGA